MLFKSLQLKVAYASLLAVIVVVHGNPRANNSNIYPKVEKSDADVQGGMTILETTDCGKSEADKSVNGGDANLSEFPWMVLLIHSDGVSRRADCSGTLITDRYVLTVAHCIGTAEPMRLVSVRLGEYNLNTTIDCVGSEKNRKCAPPVQEIDIEEAIYHKDYSPVKFRNDIGLIRLISRAMLSSSVQPICLPITSQSQAADISRMQIAGWPRQVTGLRSDILQHAELLVMDDVNRCGQLHRLIQITDDLLCAEAENHDNSCKSHSGVPMFTSLGARSIQYGIGSSGSVCLTPNQLPDIYIKVTAYLPWIAGNIRP